MAKYFNQREVFPVIAEVIRMLHKDTQDFVMHDELAEALLGHPIIKAIIARVHQQPNSPTSEWLVGNMIAWFSQKMTAATSPYRHTVEYVRMGQAFAFRPLKSA